MFWFDGVGLAFGLGVQRIGGRVLESHARLPTHIFMSFTVVSPSVAHYQHRTRAGKPRHLTQKPTDEEGESLGVETAVYDIAIKVSIQSHRQQYIPSTGALIKHLTL
jgi:hypothetical protein